MGMVGQDLRVERTSLTQVQLQSLDSERAEALARLVEMATPFAH